MPVASFEHSILGLWVESSTSVPTGHNHILFFSIKVVPIRFVNLAFCQLTKTILCGWIERIVVNLASFKNTAKITSKCLINNKKVAWNKSCLLLNIILQKMQTLQPITNIIKTESIYKSD